MATNPTPDIEVLKKRPKRKHPLLPLETVFPFESKKLEKPSEGIGMKEEEGWESPNNFFYDRKYLDL